MKAAVTSAGLVKKTPSATKTEPMMARFLGMDVDGFLAMGWLLDMDGFPAMGSWIYGHTRRREAEAGLRAAPYLPWVAGCDV